LESIKAESSINGTSSGISIKQGNEGENAPDLIPVNHEFDSNQIDERDLQSEKQHDPRI
jgi:hypothetical protein